MQINQVKNVGLGLLTLSLALLDQDPQLMVGESNKGGPGSASSLRDKPFMRNKKVNNIQIQH